MRRLVLILALAPGLALAAQNAPAGQNRAGGPGGGPGQMDPARQEMMQKRLRLARTVGLAEALDLDDAGALKARDILARFDDRRTPLRRQLRDNIRIIGDAARGDQAALGQVDGALQKLREARTQLQALDHEMFQQLTQGLPPQKKARAALFLARFHERAIHMRMHGGAGFGGGRGGPRGAMMDEGPGGQGPGMHSMPPGHPGALGMMDDGPEADEWGPEE
jgi:hypothetical protein